MANEQTIGAALRELAEVNADTLTELAASISQTELDYLDGATAGTVTASKALVADANKDLATLRHLTISGNFVSGATTLSETDLAKIDGITNGTQAAGKAVVADANVNTGVSKVTELHIGASGAEVQVTSTPAELNLLDGAGTTNPTASRAVILSATKRVISTATAGTPGTNVTAVEYSGDGLNFTSILTLSGVAATIGDNVALAGGALIYTFPAGPVVVNSATMSVGLSLTTGTPTTDTPELGLGTTQGSGANATLGDVGAGAENVLGPAVADDIAGTAELLTGAPGLAIETAGAHTLYFNYADTWADVTDTAATLDGTVVINWSRLPLS